MTTLDMQLVALRPSDGEVVGKIAISQFVPNASANYGYSQTSAPICAGGKLVMGAAGSEYGVRGYVMAFNTDLTPAWPNPYWTIPPEQQQWRRLVPDRRRRRRLDAGHDRHPHEHGLLRHRLRDAELLPRPPSRPEPARELADRGRPEHRASSAGGSSSSRTTSGTTTSRSRRSSTTRRSAARRAGSSRWRRRKASGSRSTPAAGETLHERVKVIDRVEHPPLRPGQPVTIFPSALGGVNYSPASYDPADELRLQRRGGDGRRPDPGQADADPEAAEADPGRRLPRAPERELRRPASRAGTTTARSARSTSRPAGGSGSSRRRSRSGAA